jgi:hypothetical protein
MTACDLEICLIRQRTIWPGARQRDYGRMKRLARGFEGELELETLGTLKLTNHFEQIARLRIPGGGEHAHQAFGRSFRDTTEFLKPDPR